jgi:anti-sigma factor RsiW
MFDCANVEMRELLPELAAGTLDARTRARVEEHVANCAECASELATLKLVRGAYAAPPAIDTTRIVAALPKPPVAAPASSSARSRRRWMDWRVAAALTMITVGGLSVALNRRQDGDVHPTAVDSALGKDLATAERDSVPLVIPAPRANDTAKPAASPASLRPPQHDRVELSFGGGVSDLDDASVKELLGALDEIDRAAVALSAEPDHSPVLPAGREGTR